MAVTNVKKHIVNTEMQNEWKNKKLMDATTIEVAIYSILQKNINISYLIYLV